MISLLELRDEILKRDNFILVGHVNPDGDCIGSLFAVKWYLEKLKKSAKVLLAEPPAEKYQFLAIKDDDYLLFEQYFQLDKNEINCITLDAGDMERLGDGEKIARQSYLINIDHHIDNPAYGNINYINSEKAAVGEIVYDLIKLDPDISIDKKIATAISTAIIADTGGLRYQNTTAEIFEIISRLMKIGVDVYNINRAIFASVKYSTIKLRAKVLSTLELHENGKIAYLKVKQKVLDEVGAEEKDVSGLVNYARDIIGVEVGLVFTEIEENKTRVNFRSNNYCPVNEIAAIFNGGGHPRAAGCIIDLDIEQAQALVLNKVEEYV